MKSILALFSYCYFTILLGLSLFSGNPVEAAEFSLNATYKVDAVWATAYQATVTVQNPTNASTSSWTASFSMPPDYSVSPNFTPGPGVVTVNGQNVTVKNPVGQGVISAGGSTTFKVLIVMPQSAPTVLNNLQAVANGSTPIPPTLPVAPVLNSIPAPSGQNYTVSWNSVANATSYVLQQSTSSNFSNPQTVAQGNVLSKTFSNQPNGVYYYRVQATNSAGSSPYSNVQNVTVSQTMNVPAVPVLNSIQSSSAQNYTVSWNSVPNATSYLLQQSTSSNFSNPQTVAQGNILSKTFSNQPSGVYYYRVAASNTAGSSAYSNVQNITISQPPVPPNQYGIEHSVWYIDWTSWLNGTTFILPKGVGSNGVNMINIFVGTLAYTPDGKPTLGGFGTFTSESLKAFTAYCAAQQPPIPVKVSIGGSGGMYDRCWDLLTPENLDSFAQGMADFCHAHGLVGVDFDYEYYTTVDRQVLVGTLIKKFKQLDPNFQTSLCTNAGFGPYFPWQPVVQKVLDAALISPGNCAVDRLYIMSYYDPIESEKGWVLGWANWLISNYGFTPARVSVGIDDFDAHAYDPVEFANWAVSQGFSTGHWAFDPARPK